MNSELLIRHVNERLGDIFPGLATTGSHGILVKPVGEGYWLAYSTRYRGRPELVLFSDRGAARNFAADHRRLRLRVDTSRGVELEVLTRGAPITRPQLQVIKAVTETTKRLCEQHNIQLTPVYGPAA